jgi:hypothetical protein
MLAAFRESHPGSPAYRRYFSKDRIGRPRIGEIEKPVKQIPLDSQISTQPAFSRRNQPGQTGSKMIRVLRNSSNATGCPSIVAGDRDL